MGLAHLGTLVQAQTDSSDPILEFHQEYGPHWEIQLHPEFGTPTLIQATKPLGIFAEDGYSIPVGGETLEEKAELFLQKHSALLGLTESWLGNSLVHFSTQQSAKRSKVRFLQQVSTVPVVGHGYQVYFNSEDEITLILGLFDPDLDIDVSVLIPGAAARSLASERAHNLLHRTVPAHLIDAKFHRTVIVNEPNSPYLAQVISVFSEDKANVLDAMIHIDAKTGAIRSEVSRVLPATGGEGFDFTRPDPPFVSEQASSLESIDFDPALDPTYGTVYATSPADGSPITVELDQLTSSTYLIGNVVDSKPTSGTRASAGPDFFFSSTNPKLDEINVYYHLTDMSDYMESLFSSTYPMKESKTYSSGVDDASYSPTSNSWFFSSASNSAGISSKDDDIIRHEFVHLALFEEGFDRFDNLGNPLGIHLELHEAFADYFATTYDDNPDWAEWLSKCSS